MNRWWMMALIALCVALVSAPALALIWHPDAIDNPGHGGQQSAVAVTSTNLPVMCYYDPAGTKLKYAWTEKGIWRTVTVDNTADVGKWCDLALDGSDRPHISYYDATNKELKYAYLNGSDPRNDTWDIDVVHSDSSDDVGWYTSIAVDGSNHPHISYHHYSDGRLYYAHDDGTGWDTDLVDSGNTGLFTSIAVTSTGTPHIAYYDPDREELWYATPGATDWATMEIDDNGNVGQYVSIGLTGGNSPRVSYYDVTNSRLLYATYNGAVWTPSQVDNSADVGAGTSLVLDASSRPHIAYYDATNASLKYARWDGAQWDIETADSDNPAGQWPSLALDGDGLPHVSYARIDTGRPKYNTPAGAWLFFLDSDPRYEDGVRPNKGVAGDHFRFRVIFQDSRGWGAVNPVVFVYKNGSRFKRVDLKVQDDPPIYSTGALYQGGTKLPEGEYKYRMRAMDLGGRWAGGKPTNMRKGISVSATSGTLGLLASLSAAPTSVGAQMTFSLASAATVDARIVNLAGRPVRQVVAGRELEAGLNTLVWDGRNSESLSVPAGQYIVVVEARTDDGGQDRRVCPVLMGK